MDIYAEVKASRDEASSRDLAKHHRHTIKIGIVERQERVNGSSQLWRRPSLFPQTNSRRHND